MRNASTILVEKLKRPLGKTRLSIEYNIKIYLKEMGWQFVDWVEVAQVRDQSQDFLNTVIFFVVL
jgi:peptide subunit release factor RF-3